MAEEALAAHPEFQLSLSGSPAPPTPGGEDPNRPSIGIMSFSGEIFDGTALAYGEGKAYSKLKRCVRRWPSVRSGSSSVDSHGCLCRSFTALLCLVMIMSGLLVVIYVGYQANPKWQGDHTHYSNCAPSAAPNSSPSTHFR